jgi:hypothetical protein
MWWMRYSKYKHCMGSYTRSYTYAYTYTYSYTYAYAYTNSNDYVRHSWSLR